MNAPGSHVFKIGRDIQMKGFVKRGMNVACAQEPGRSLSLWGVFLHANLHFSPPSAQVVQSHGTSELNPWLTLRLKLCGLTLHISLP